MWYLKTGYWQVEVLETERQKMAFVAPSDRLPTSDAEIIDWPIPKAVYNLPR